jgi:hypothetical protein
VARLAEQHEARIADALEQRVIVAGRSDDSALGHP